MFNKSTNKQQTNKQTVLMMTWTEMVLKMLVYLAVNHLMWLLAEESFIGAW